MKFFHAILAAALVATFTLSCNTSQAAKLPKDANTTCPVMIKEEVNPDLHVEYKGRTIYLCCTKCKRKFLQNPDKYIAHLKSEDKATTATKVKPKPNVK